MQVANFKTTAPSIRFKLKATIIAAGFHTYSKFAKVIGTDLSRLSRVMNGHEWPSPALQQRICKELGITLRELRDLL